MKPSKEKVFQRGWNDHLCLTLLRGQWRCGLEVIGDHSRCDGVMGARPDRVGSKEDERKKGKAAPRVTSSMEFGYRGGGAEK